MKGGAVGGWWFHFFFSLSHSYFGEMIQFDEHIFFKGVGSTTKTSDSFGRKVVELESELS